MDLRFLLFDPLQHAVGIYNLCYKRFTMLQSGITSLILNNLPPLIITPPNKKNTLWVIFYYKFKRRHDYPLINDDCWFDLPPSKLTPLIKKTLGGKKVFTTNLDGGTITPLIKTTMFGQTTPNTKQMWFGF